MAPRFLGLVLCGLLAGCIASPRKPAETFEASERSPVPDALVVGNSGGPEQSLAAGTSGGGGGVQSTAVDGSAEAVQRPAESVNAANSDGGAGGAVFHAHGTWRRSDADPSRWKSALENYVPSVRRDNVTPLNTARRPFAEYLNRMHNRIHPLFADSWLGSLDHLAVTHPLNDPRLSTEVEIILDQKSGDIERMGVTKASGIAAFDVAALETVKRAAPFGTPPPEIVSPDGKVYAHWTFHRNREACSTLNAWPFLLKAQRKAAADGASLEGRDGGP